MSQIQGYQTQGQIYALDTNKNSNLIVAGSRQCIIVLQINLDKQYWFDKKHLITKYRYQNQTKPLVNALDWNKYGKDLLAIGTMYGYVFVYDLTTDKPQHIFSMKGPDSMVKKITWEPDSTNVIYSANYQYCILKYDIRCKQKHVEKNQYDFSVKFRDIKFNPHRKNILAAGQFSQFVQLFDIRKMNKSFLCISRQVEDQSGCVVDWDPNCASRLATAGAKSINIWNWDGAKLTQQTLGSSQNKNKNQNFDSQQDIYSKLENSDLKKLWYGGTLQQEQIFEYSKINSFKWLKHTDNSFAISDHYIYLYNRKNPDIPYKQFGGNSKHVDCWLMNNNQQLIISASMTKNKAKNSKGITAGQNSLIVVQRQQNGINPIEERLSYPVTFNCNNQFATTIKNTYYSNNEHYSNRNNIHSHSIPLKNNIVFSINNFQNDFNTKNFGSSLREQIQYLDKQYLRNGKSEVISQKNSAVARLYNKPYCQKLWINLFHLAFPQKYNKHTVHSIFEQNPNIPVKIENNCITANSSDLLLRTTKKCDIQSILQQLVDQNQLQTAVIAAICLLNKNKDKQNPIISQAFMEKIVHPYIQLLRNLQLFVIATNTFLETGMKIFRQITNNGTLFSVSCGTCKKSLTKNQCICNSFCVSCKQSMKDRMIIWCKFCGHGGHAVEYEDKFKRKSFCSHGCQHQCFNANQNTYLNIQEGSEEYYMMQRFVKSIINDDEEQQ